MWIIHTHDQCTHTQAIMHGQHTNKEGQQTHMHTYTQVMHLQTSMSKYTDTLK